MKEDFPLSTKRLFTIKWICENRKLPLYPSNAFPSYRLDFKNIYIDNSNRELDKEEINIKDLSKANNPIDNNKNTIGDNISSLEEPAPNVITVPMTGTNVPTGSGASGSSSSNTPTSTIPQINSSDATNPYVSYSESLYGVHD